MFRLPATPMYFTPEEIDAIVESEYPRLWTEDEYGRLVSTVDPDRDAFRRALCKQSALASPESLATHSPQPEPRKMATNKQTPAQIQHAFALAVSCERQKSPNITRQQAIARVAKRDPDLHQHYCDSLPDITSKLPRR